MTAEPDLLPCPFCGSENIDPKGWASTNSAGPACDDCGASAGGVSGTLQDNIARRNTRANVSHATAAKNAEIEALRAEVDLRDSVIATHAADTREYQKRISQAEARAERLAEALREARDAIEDWAGYASDYFREKHDLAGDLAKIDALLRDQEEWK